MERCSEIVTQAYSLPVTQLAIHTGELPPGHRTTDRRQRCARGRRAAHGQLRSSGWRAYLIGWLPPLAGTGSRSTTET